MRAALFAMEDSTSTVGAIDAKLEDSDSCSQSDDASSAGGETDRSGGEWFDEDDEMCYGKNIGDGEEVVDNDEAWQDAQNDADADKLASAMVAMKLRVSCPAEAHMAYHGDFGSFSANCDGDPPTVPDDQALTMRRKIKSACCTVLPGARHSLHIHQGRVWVRAGCNATTAPSASASSEPAERILLRLRNGGPVGEVESLRVVSYNILADALACSKRWVRPQTPCVET